MRDRGTAGMLPIIQSHFCKVSGKFLISEPLTKQTFNLRLNKKKTKQKQKQVSALYPNNTLKVHQERKYIFSQISVFKYLK